jgi:hypothetical protein
MYLEMKMGPASEKFYVFFIQPVDTACPMKAL